MSDPIKVTREQWDAAVERLNRRVPGMTPSYARAMVRESLGCERPGPPKPEPLTLEHARAAIRPDAVLWVDGSGLTAAEVRTLARWLEQAADYLREA